MVNNLLLFRLRYLGDVLLTTPAIRLLRQRYPESHITMVVNKGTEDILRYNPHLNAVLPLERGRAWRLLRQLRERRYDVSLDFLNGDRAALMAWAAGASLRIGFEPERRWRRGLFHRMIAKREEHMVEKCLRLLDEGLGLKATDTSLELRTGPEDERHVNNLPLPEKPFAVVHLGCRYPVNRWPREHWVAFARALPMPVVYVGGPAEAADTEWVLSSAQSPAVSVVGQTTVLQLAALLKRASVFVGHDSGPMHMAVAMGTQVAAFFGPESNVRWWRPWGEGHQVLSTSSTVAEALEAVRLRKG